MTMVNSGLLGVSLNLPLSSSSTAANYFRNVLLVVAELVLKWVQMKTNIVNTKAVSRKCCSKTLEIKSFDTD